MSRVKQIHYRKITRPTRTVFATSLGSKSHITSILVKVVLEDGATGVGEVPTSFSFPLETPLTIKCVLTEARSMMRGMPIEDYPSALSRLRENHCELFELPLNLPQLDTSELRADMLEEQIFPMDPRPGAPVIKEKNPFK